MPEPRRKLRVQFLGREQGCVEVFSFHCQTQGAQLRHGKASQGRSQHRCQRDILAGIVHHRQKIQHQPDLMCLEIAAADIRIGGDAAAPQDFQQDIRLARNCTQQHRNIPKGNGSVFPSHKHHIPRFNKSCNTPGDMLCFQFKALQLCSSALSFCPGFCSFLFPGQDNIQFHRACQGACARRRLRVSRAGIELALVIIVDFHGLLAHKLIKKEIDRREYLRPTAEILPHGNQLILIPPARLQGKGFILPLEQMGVRQTETVDALLDITDDEAAAGRCNQREDGLLHAVRILVLVNHDFLEFMLQLQCHLTGLIAVLLQACGISLIRCAPQYLQRIVLQIVEVQHAPLLLGCAKSLAEIQRQLRIAAHRRRALCQLPQKFFLTY